MYTVPIKTSVHAKDLIASFEKGKTPAAADADPSDSAPAEGSSRLNREVSVEELAQPGTARTLLLAFESKAKLSGNADNAAIRSPGFKTKNRLSREVSSDTAANGSGTTDATLSASEPVTSISVEEAGITETAEVPPALDAAADSAEGNVAPDVEIPQTAVASIQEEDQTDAPSLSPSSKTVLLLCCVRDKTPVDYELIDKAKGLLEASQHLVFVTDLGKYAPLSDAEIIEERRKVAAADLLVVMYQPAFNCVPASLQAWIEAILDVDEATNQYSSKKCVILLTTPRRQDEFSASSVLGDISVYLWPPQVGIIRHVGFRILEPYVVYNTKEVDINQIVNQWSDRLSTIWNETDAQVTN